MPVNGNKILLALISIVLPGVIPAKQGNPQSFFNKVSNSRYAFSDDEVEIPEIVGGGARVNVDNGFLRVGEFTKVEVSCGEGVFAKVIVGSAILECVMQEFRDSNAKSKTVNKPNLLISRKAVSFLFLLSLITSSNLPTLPSTS